MRYLLLLLSILLVVSCEAFAQMPGHWEKTFSAKGWTPVDMAFTDSTYGLILVDSIWRGPHGGNAKPTTVRTTDAGLSWQLRPPFPPHQGDLPFLRTDYHSFYLPTHQDVSAFTGNFALFSHDSGVTWESINYEDNTMFASSGRARIFENEIGFCCSSKAIGDTGITVFRTEDFGRHFIATASPGHRPTMIHDVVYLDTSEFWASDSRGWMEHTTNSGFSWSVLPILNSRIKWCDLSEIAPTSDRARLYVLFVAPSAPTDTAAYPDFASTTNGGLTWRIDSSLHGARMYRLAPQSPDKLWAFVGQGQYNGSADLSQPYHFLHADSLFYSPDGGLSWSKDSTTFIGDTLVEMVWPDSNHGYIVAWRDRSMLVYRYVPNGVGAVASTRVPQPAGLHILSSPVTDVLSFEAECTGIATVRIYDVLGHERRTARQRLAAGESAQLSVSNLEPGYYTLSLTVDGVTLSAGFVKL